MSNDNETNKRLAEAAALEAMFESSGWKIAERRLQDLLAELRDVSNLDLASDDVTQQVRDRINLVAAVEAWIDDLKGDISNATRLSEDDHSSTIIERL